MTICWEPLLDALNACLSITQSAGNPVALELLGIFRDYTPQFICCFKILKQSTGTQNDSRFFNLTDNNKTYKDLSNLNFGHYVTGLIEGDGSIIVPTSERSAKGRINYPSIQIAFNLKDLPLALLIQKELGHGSLSRKKGVNAYILTINSYTGLLLVVSLINGNMRTPKIYAL